jgi:hypothetical protein
VSFEETIFKRIRGLIDQHSEYIIQGSVPSHEEYRHICGVIKGLSMAEVELKELLVSEEEDL